MNQHQPLELPSYEVLSRLARDDPQAYEVLRSEVIESFINSAPERLKHRLSGLQFHVDGLRRLSRSSALGATVKIYSLMWGSFQQLNQAWQSFTREPARHATLVTKYVPQRNAQILQFRPHLERNQYSAPAAREM